MKCKYNIVSMILSKWFRICCQINMFKSMYHAHL